MNRLQKALHQSWSSIQEANFHTLSAHSPELDCTAEDHLKQTCEHLLKAYEATKKASELLKQSES